MICSDFARADVRDFTMADFWACLRGPSHVVTLSGGAPIDVGGLLWGGNLSMLVHLLGTAFMPAVDGGILFIEDINEHPFRIERMLLQLLHAGVLERQQAVVLGEFSGARTGDYDNGYDFDAMLAYLRSRTTVPLLTGLPFGHVRDKATLVVGSHAHLRGDREGMRLTMHGYPALAKR